MTDVSVSTMRHVPRLTVIVIVKPVGWEKGATTHALITDLDPTVDSVAVVRTMPRAQGEL